MPEQFGENLGAEEFLQNPMRDFRRRVPDAVVVQEAVGRQGMDVRKVLVDECILRQFLGPSIFTPTGRRYFIPQKCMNARRQRIGSSARSRTGPRMIRAG